MDDDLEKEFKIFDRGVRNYLDRLDSMRKWPIQERIPLIIELFDFTFKYERFHNRNFKKNLISKLIECKNTG
jgi:hypothetical protein